MKSPWQDDSTSQLNPAPNNQNVAPQTQKAEFIPVSATAQEARLKGIKMLAAGVGLLVANVVAIRALGRFYALAAIFGPVLISVGLSMIVAPVTTEKPSASAKVVFFLMTILGFAAGFYSLYLLKR